MTNPDRLNYQPAIVCDDNIYVETLSVIHYLSKYI